MCNNLQMCVILQQTFLFLCNSLQIARYEQKNFFTYRNSEPTDHEIKATRLE